MRAIPMDHLGRRAPARSTLEECGHAPVLAAWTSATTSDFTAFVVLFPHDDAEIVTCRRTRATRTATRCNRPPELYAGARFWLPESPRGGTSGWRRRSTPGACRLDQDARGDVVDYDGSWMTSLSLAKVTNRARSLSTAAFRDARWGRTCSSISGEQVFELPAGHPVHERAVPGADRADRSRAASTTTATPFQAGWPQHRGRDRAAASSSRPRSIRGEDRRHHGRRDGPRASTVGSRSRIWYTPG